MLNAFHGNLLTLQGGSQYPHFRDRESGSPGRQLPAPQLVKVGTRTWIFSSSARDPSHRQLEARTQRRPGAVAPEVLGTTPASQPLWSKTRQGPWRRRGLLRLRFPKEKARPAPQAGGDAETQASFSSRPRPPGLEPPSAHLALGISAFPRTRGCWRFPRRGPPLHSPRIRRRTSSRAASHGY